MELLIENIAKISYANVELNGITVIAGENNTGKSTIGKVLYSVFNSFYELENQIANEKVSSIENIIDNYFIEGFGTILSSTSRELANEIVKNFSISSFDDNELKTELLDFIFHYSPLSRKNSYIIEETDIESLKNRIVEILKISDIEFLQSVISKKLSTEFNRQINNIYTESAGSIHLKIKDICTELLIENNYVTNSFDLYNLNTEVVYIDDPFVIDDIRYRQNNYYNNYSDHKNHLRRKLVARTQKHGVIGELITNQKLENIFSKISSVCNGEIVTIKGNNFGFRKEDTEKILDIKNISTGLKTFVILKTLLENGSLEYNGTIILDEPEIHEHPQWQLILAELIVLIQKEFNMHILINTHSPYFLKAIEVFSAKYEIAHKCKFYLAQCQSDDTSKIIDVTSSPEEIYKLLARPLQDLENARFQND